MKLTLLFKLMDWTALPPPIRAEFTAALIRLSRKSGCHPELFGLSGLTRSDAQVAGGAFGDIWQGLLRGRKVSVKVARVFRNDDMQRFVKLQLSSILWSQLSHPNVLPLYGTYCLDNAEASRLCLVSPWMDNGNIVDFLKDAPALLNRQSLILDIALGIQYLHQASVIHGDLKGLNILVTPSHRACLMDFGLSSIAGSAIPNWTSLSVQHGGTARWQSPEILHGGPNSFKGDIYAFGCVCYEVKSTSEQVFTGRVPFYNVSNEPAVILNIVRGVRPTRPELPELNDDIWSLIQDCWKMDPNDRPTAGQMVKRLSAAGIQWTSGIDSEWNESFARDLRRSLRPQQLVPSHEELKALLKRQNG
ncbi:kinase-like domain-containing protein [Mycena floridula]|nr:kinase-like domain-containing protein [Mycena floridula]